MKAYCGSTMSRPSNCRVWANCASCPASPTSRRCVPNCPTPKRNRQNSCGRWAWRRWAMRRHGKSNGRSRSRNCRASRRFSRCMRRRASSHCERGWRARWRGGKRPTSGLLRCRMFRAHRRLTRRAAPPTKRGRHSNPRRACWPRPASAVRTRWRRAARSRSRCSAKKPSCRTRRSANVARNGRRKSSNSAPTWPP